MPNNASVGQYLMQKLQDAAMQNFLKGIFSFVMFGKVRCEIQHMHSDEYAVCIFDPVIREFSEILRIKDSANPDYI